MRMTVDRLITSRTVLIGVLCLLFVQFEHSIGVNAQLQPVENESGKLTDSTQLKLGTFGKKLYLY